jgi:hypothetical protein
MNQTYKLNYPLKTSENILGGGGVIAANGNGTSFWVFFLQNHQYHEKLSASKYSFSSFLHRCIFTRCCQLQVLKIITLNCGHAITISPV